MPVLRSAAQTLNSTGARSSESQLGNAQLEGGCLFAFSKASVV